MGKYIAYDNGTVLDTETGLMWMRCLLGQTWNDKTCMGEAEGFTWDDACKQSGNGFAGYSDWRVPTIEELKTLVDKTQSGAKIHPQAFPNTPDFVWSSSAYANASGGAWGVYFSSGYDNSSSRSSSHHVRLVRGGQ